MVSVIECASFSSDSEGFLPLNAKIIKDSDYVQPGISEAEFNQLINEIAASPWKIYDVETTGKTPNSRPQKITKAEKEDLVKPLLNGYHKDRVGTDLPFLAISEDGGPTGPIMLRQRVLSILYVTYSGQYRAIAFDLDAWRKAHGYNPAPTARPDAVYRIMEAALSKQGIGLNTGFDLYWMRYTMREQARLFNLPAPKQHCSDEPLLDAVLLARALIPDILLLFAQRRDFLIQVKSLVPEAKDRDQSEAATQWHAQMTAAIKYVSDFLKSDRKGTSLADLTFLLSNSPANKTNQGPKNWITDEISGDKFEYAVGDVVATHKIMRYLLGAAYHKVLALTPPTWSHPILECRPDCLDGGIKVELKGDSDKLDFSNDAIFESLSLSSLLHPTDSLVELPITVDVGSAYKAIRASKLSLHSVSGTPSLDDLTDKNTGTYHNVLSHLEWQIEDVVTMREKGYPWDKNYQIDYVAHKQAEVNERATQILEEAPELLDFYKDELQKIAEKEQAGSHLLKIERATKKVAKAREALAALLAENQAAQESLQIKLDVHSATSGATLDRLILNAEADDDNGVASSESPAELKAREAFEKAAAKELKKAQAKYTREQKLRDARILRHETVIKEEEAILAQPRPDVIEVEPPTKEELIALLASAADGITLPLKHTVARLFKQYGLTLTETSTGLPQVGTKDLRKAQAQNNPKSQSMFFLWSSLFAFKKTMQMSAEASTFVEDSTGGRIHSIIGHGPITGRLSSAEPNAQQMPKEQKFRNAVKARDGYLICAVDFSALDMRVGAALAIRCQRRIQAFYEQQLPNSITDSDKVVPFGYLSAELSAKLVAQIHLVKSRAHTPGFFLAARQKADLDLANASRDKFAAGSTTAHFRQARDLAVFAHTLSLVQDKADAAGTPEWSCLRDAFAIPDMDIHTWTALNMIGQDPAALFVGKSNQEIASILSAQKKLLGKKRDTGKVGNLSLTYGMSAMGLRETAAKSYNIHWTLEESAKIRADWLSAYPEIELWHMWTKLTHGWNFNERSITLPQFNSWNNSFSDRNPQVFACDTLAGRRIFAYGLNAALSYEDQSTGADIMAAAMRDLRNNNPDVFDCLILQVHDEMVAELPIKHAKKYTEIIHKTMVDAAARYTYDSWGVPCEVTPATARTWVKENPDEDIWSSPYVRSHLNPEDIVEVTCIEDAVEVEIKAEVKPEPEIVPTPDPVPVPVLVPALVSVPVLVPAPLPEPAPMPTKNIQLPHRKQRVDPTTGTLPVCTKTTTTTQLESARNLGEFLQSLQSMDGEIEQNGVELIAAALRADSEININVPEAYRILREAIVSTYPDLNTSSGLVRARACADKTVAVLWPKFKVAARARDVRVQPTGTNNVVATTTAATAKTHRRIVPTKTKPESMSVAVAVAVDVAAVAEPTATPVAPPVVNGASPSMNFWDTLKSELLPEVESVPVSVPVSVPTNVPANVPAPFPESTATTKMDHAIMESDVPESTAATAATATVATTMPAQDFPQRRRRV